MKKATRSEKQGSQSHGQTTTTSQGMAPSKIARILGHLLNAGPLNRFEAEHLLNIMRPGARIAELRAQGHNIRTHLGTIEDLHGRKHPKVATYYLSADPVGKVAA